MKICIPLLYSFACIAMEDIDIHNGKPVTVTNNINVTQTQNRRGGRWQGGAPEKHPSVAEAHEKSRLQAIREQDDRDAVTCCCFFKIKKRI
jgi:hypothetical protein